MEKAALPPRISVILPTCNRVQLALDCIASILQGDYADFEIIVVDQDASRALEQALSARFGGDPRIIYHFLDKAALDHARNIGIDLARGQVLVFVDDDVEVDKAWLRAYVNAFEAICPDPGIIAGRLDPLWLSPPPKWLPEDRKYLFGIYPADGTLRPMPESDLPIGANFAVHHGIIDQVGRFDERLDYSYARKTSMISGGDSLFSLKAKQAGYSIYYQPAARAWHKLSNRKLTKKYFLARSFWDGVTLIIVMHLTGSAKRDNALTIARWHSKEIIRQIWHFLLSIIQPDPESDWSKRGMRTLSLCANSLGIIYAALKLRQLGSLP